MIHISSYMEMITVLTRGLGITVNVLIGSAIVSFVLAFLAGFSRLSSNVLLQRTTAVYVEFFSGTSLLVHMFWIYDALSISPYVAGVAAYGLIFGAYWSPLEPRCVLSVSHVDTEACLFLHMRRLSCTGVVSLPQAMQMLLPSFVNY